MFLTTIIVLVIVYISLNIYLVARKNRKAHQFFKNYAPDLPVVANPKIFSGHAFDIMLQPKNCKIVDELHKKLGPSFGHYYSDQPWIATKDLELIKKVHIDGARQNLNRAHVNFPLDELSQSIVEATDSDWRRARQVVSVSLTKSKVLDDEITKDFSICVQKLHSTIEKRLDKAELVTGKREYIMEDTHDLLQRYSLAVVLLASYRQGDMIDFESEKDLWIGRIRATLDNTNNIFLYTAVIFPFLRPFMTTLAGYHSVGQMPKKLLEILLKNMSINKRAREYHEKLQKRIGHDEEAREAFSLLKEQGEFKRRLADSLIDSYFEKRITLDDLKSNLLILVLVGFEATSNTGTLLTWFLARYPQVQEKLREEVRLYGTNSEYLQWCILETVRFQCAVPFGGGRILKEDITLDGKTYPKGAHVIPSLYSIHHDPEIWPNPKEFIPDRWSKKADFHPAAMLGFGVGARNCPGYQFASHELRLVAQMLVTHYKIETCSDTVKEYNFSSQGLLFSLFDDKIKLKIIPLKKDN